MKRFWINTSSFVGNRFNITSSNNIINLAQSSNTDSFTLSEGSYTLDTLVQHLVSKGIDADIGEKKSDENIKFIVVFTENSYNMVSGSLVDSLGGIESIDTGDRLEGSILYST